MLAVFNLGPLWMDLKVGLILLTRLPLRHDGEISAREHAGALRFYPVVGLLAGLAAAGAYWFALVLGLPPLLAGFVAVAATALLTGAFHEDGLADLADGFGGGTDRERKLEIMRDSRIGTYGALALTLSVALRGGALAALATPAAAASALIAAHCLSRALLPPAMAVLPPARASGLAASVDRPGAQQVATALLLAGAVVLFVLGVERGLAAIAFGSLGAGAVLLLARSQIGGYTGDVLGAVQQAGEVAVLLTVVALQ